MSRTLLSVCLAVFGCGVGRVVIADETCVVSNGDTNGDHNRDVSDVIYFLGWAFLGGPAPIEFCETGAPSPACATENGDTNGDRKRDVSDAIYFLAWSFLGGPEPVPPCGSEGGVIRPVRGHLALPAGAGFVPEDTVVKTFVGSGVPSANGDFTVDIIREGPQLAFASGPAGAPILAGWLSPTTTTLDARSTAEVLVFFALGTHLQDPTVVERARAELGMLESISTITRTIEEVIAGGATSLEELPPDIMDPLFAEIVPLAREDGRREEPIVRGLLTPLAAKSGIRIDDSMQGSIEIINSYRRRTMVWVDRTGFKDAPEDPYTDIDEQIAELEIGPVRGFSSVIGTITDWITGNVAYTPVSSGAIATPLDPAGSFATRYAITVLGVGLDGIGDAANVPQDRMDRLRRLGLETLFLDLFLPVVINIIVPSRGSELQSALGGIDATRLTSALSVIQTAADSAVTKLLEGRVREALLDMANTVSGLGPVREAIFDLVADVIEDFSGDAANDFLDAADIFNRVLTGINAAGTAIDTLVQVTHLAQSRVGEKWAHEVLQSRVTVTPRVSSIRPGETAMLEATVQDGAGQSFTYAWSHASGLGTLDPPGETSQNRVAFRANADAEGTEEIRVDVFRPADAEGPRRFIGSGQARVEVFPSRPRLVRERSSVPPGGAVRIEVRMDPEWTGGPLFYTWRTTTEHGDFRLPPLDFGTATSEDWVARDDGDGVDQVSVLVHTLNNGQQVEVGTAVGEVRVEENPSIIDGTYIPIQYPIDDVTSGVEAIVQFAEEPDARGYTLRGYLGHDPFFFGSRILIRSPFRLSARAQAIKPSGVQWVPLSGAFGADPGGAIEWMDSRFGSGWVWEVEVLR